jgi:hypothetical protein
VQQPDDGERPGEHDRCTDPAALVSPGLRDREGDEEQGRHRDHHRAAEHALVGVRLVAEPGVAAPGPPQEEQQHEPAQCAPPAEVVGHERGHLGDREDEDQVEEQLQRGDPVAGVARQDPGAET